MAAILDQYPEAEPIVRGDPLDVLLTVVGQNISTWTWQAQVRSGPDGEVVASFTSAPVVGHTDQVVFSLTGTQTRLLKPTMGFDIACVTPTPRTIVVVRSLYLERDYSHA